jgi:hypothetical protein
VLGNDRTLQMSMQIGRSGLLWPPLGRPLTAAQSDIFCKVTAAEADKATGASARSDSEEPVHVQQISHPDRSTGRTNPE